MWKISAALMLVPVYAMTGQSHAPVSAPVKAESMELAQLNSLDSFGEMDMLKARAMQSQAISMQTYAMITAR